MTYGFSGNYNPAAYDKRIETPRAHRCWRRVVAYWLVALSYGLTTYVLSVF